MSKVKFTVYGNENHFSSDDEVKQFLEGLISRTEDNFSDGKKSVEAHEDLKWMMRQTQGGISFDDCCLALNKDPEEERMRLLMMYSEKHFSQNLKKGH